mgnify:CR=1 FL=1
MPKGSSISYGRTFIAPRKMRVATLSAGYADGYPWHLSNRDAAVLVRGQRCAILGRVTMDLMMIDVSKIDNAQVGDEVVLMGRDGNEEISCVGTGQDCWHDSLGNHDTNWRACASEFIFESLKR